MRSKTLKPFGRGAANSLRVSLTDRNPEVARALASRFDEVDAVEVLEGDLLSLDCDALVSPANSFGFMDGGIDQSIDRFYGGAAQRAVLDRIADRFYGELPVGSATVIGMPSARFRFLVVAPTMRVPGDSRGTINAYLAMRAALVAVLDHNGASAGRIASMVVPGLCTGVGWMPADESASQMRAAYDMIIGGGWQTIVHPAQAPFALRPVSPQSASGEP
ncbi:MAG TPA: macro domain-containing protein [Chloroflexota bacterium]|jgi:O-acetyl-ADP-ribose deacetylase (regulator of RNase III)|nr:macro domain-containing protein [Chloroflexota bacterium]